MTDRDKQRLENLEEKTAYLLARQEAQEARMNQITARLVYLEARQYRLMKEIGLESSQVDTRQAAQDDAKQINLTTFPQQRLN